MKRCKAAKKLKVLPPLLEEVKELLDMMGLAVNPNKVTLVGFVVHALHRGEFLSSEVIKEDIEHRTWTMTPEFAMRFDHPQEADKAIKRYKRPDLPIAICALYETPKQFFITCIE